MSGNATGIAVHLRPPPPIATLESNNGRSASSLRGGRGRLVVGTGESLQRDDSSAREQPQEVPRGKDRETGDEQAARDVRDAPGEPAGQKDVGDGAVGGTQVL